MHNLKRIAALATVLASGLCLAVAPAANAAARNYEAGRVRVTAAAASPAVSSVKAADLPAADTS